MTIWTVFCSKTKEIFYQTFGKESFSIGGKFQ